MEGETEQEKMEEMEENMEREMERNMQEAMERGRDLLNQAQLGDKNEALSLLTQLSHLVINLVSLPLLFIFLLFTFLSIFLFTFLSIFLFSFSYSLSSSFSYSFSSFLFPLSFFPLQLFNSFSFSLLAPISRTDPFPSILLKNQPLGTRDIPLFLLRNLRIPSEPEPRDPKICFGIY